MNNEKELKSVALNEEEINEVSGGCIAFDGSGDEWGRFDDPKRGERMEKHGALILNPSISSSKEPDDGIRAKIRAKIRKIRVKKDVL